MTHGFHHWTHCQAATQVKRLTKGGGSWQGGILLSLFPSHSSLPIWRFFPEKLFHSGRKKEIMKRKKMLRKTKKKLILLFPSARREGDKIDQRNCMPPFLMLFIYLLIYFSDLQLVVVLQNRRERPCNPHQRHDSATNFRHIATITKKTRPQQM